MKKNASRDLARELEIALENRAFEIQLFWQRSNYFLVLMTALGIGTFTIEDNVFSALVAVFAAITSWYWYQTNLGSKFWQESWEVEVVQLAKELKIRSFERPTAEIIDQVQESLVGARTYPTGASRRKRFGIWVRRQIDNQIVKKPSVSHYMILLSATSIVLWTIVAGVYTVDVFNGAGRGVVSHTPSIPKIETRTNRQQNAVPRSPTANSPPNPTPPDSNLVAQEALKAGSTSDAKVTAEKAP